MEMIRPSCSRVRLHWARKEWEGLKTKGTLITEYVLGDACTKEQIKLFRDGRMAAVVESDVY